MIDYLHIKGYKSIKDSRIELRPVNLLIGANGSGKSNLLSFFSFLDALYNRKLKEFIAFNKGAEYILYNGRNTTNGLSFDIGFRSLNRYKVVLETDSSGDFFFQEEKLYYMNNQFLLDNASYKKESELKLIRNIKAKPVFSFFDQLKKFHFHDTSSDKSPFREWSNVLNDIHFLYEKGNNLAAILYNIQQESPKIYMRIVKSIESIAPFFSDFYLKPNKQHLLRLQWQDKYSSTTYGPEDLSDGTLRFIALTTLFLQPDPPKTIIIDEPELGLHPAAIAKLSGMIKVAVKKGSQVIAATQSPDFVNYFEPEDILTVDNSGSSDFRRLNSEELSEWIEDYSVGELWQRNIIEGGQPE